MDYYLYLCTSKQFKKGIETFYINNCIFLFNQKQKKMKKTIFSFAIAAVAVAMVSCGNKTAQNAEGTDSTAVAEEQAIPEETVIEDIHKLFSVVVPNGWEGKAESFATTLRKPAAEAGENEVTVEINTAETAFNEEKQTYGLTGEDKVAEEKLGENTWTVYVKQNEVGYRYNAIAPRPGKEGYIYARGFSKDGYSDDLKLALSGIKLAN